MKKDKIAKKRYITLGICIIAAITLWLVYGHVSQSRDRQRFKEAEETKSQIVAQLVAYLGDNVKEISEHNECFNTEQGPHDKGRLWCQTATNIVLETDISYKTAGSEFLAIGSGLSLRVGSSNGSFPRFWSELQNGGACHLQYRSARLDDFGGARRIPLENGPALAVACADRAKARHYPYTE